MLNMIRNWGRKGKPSDPPQICRRCGARNNPYGWYCTDCGAGL